MRSVTAPPKGKKHATRAKPKVQKEDPKVHAAKKAVKEFEDKRSELDDMREEFANNFPEANEVLTAIDEVEDETRSLIGIAKELVRDAGMTIGEFKFQAKNSRPGYNPKKLLDTILEEPEFGPEVLWSLATSGAVGLTVDQKSMGVYMDRYSGEVPLDDSWEDKKPLTPAITAPKI